MADKALLTGINNYKSISDLQGCLNDVANIKALLIDSYGFKTENISELHDDEVIYDTLKDKFDWLYEGAEPGDRLVFHFSGHGSFIASKDDDEPIDELLCLYDMEWDNEDSYLLDDDLGEFLEKKPEGVDMTVILDACHSGHGTKAMTSQGRSAKSVTQRSTLVIVDDAKNTGERALGKDFDPEKDKLNLKGKKPPLARFVFPPAKVQAHAEVAGKSKQRQVSRIGDQFRSGDALNHQLLAGAKDSQTAADAYIEAKYQGAFTYNLCKAAREKGNVSVSTLLTLVRSALSSNGHSQIPQLEGTRQDERLFGGPAISDPVDDRPVLPESAMEIDASDDSVVNDSHLESFNQLMRTQEKFLDLGNRLLSLGNTADSKSRDTTADAVGGGSRGTEHIVYVHGINQHRAGYSNAWYSAMHPHLSRSIPRSEVIWSDIVNPRSVERQSSDEAAEREKLQREIEEQLSKRQQQDAELAGEAAHGSGSRSLFSSGFKMDDFLRYMTSKATRKQILARFDNVVRPLLQSGKTIHIISHSWGTVVAYEGLRNLDNETFSGSVKNLFTAGSALSIGTVRRNLFGRVTDGRRPKYVRRIFNLDAGGDPVGGSFAGHFSVDSEYIGLAPVGCKEIPFTNIAFNPVCAHASYFRPANLLVNRNIFARWINS